MLSALLLATAPVVAPVAATVAVPTGTLTLDRDAPVVTALVAGRPMRLRVALDQHGVIELNPDAAARLTDVAFERDGGVQVGRTTLAGRIAHAPVTIAGRPVDAPLSSYPRPCCAGVDGEIAPDLLPYATVRLVRPIHAAPPGPSDTRTLVMVRDPDLGLFARADTPGGPLLVLLTLDHDATLATGAAGAVLARAGGGRFVGPALHAARAFGIARPVRAMTLDRPVAVAGFAIDRALVRIADFRGTNRLPALPPPSGAPADIRVTARARTPQHAIPAITLGRDLIGHCHDILYTAATRALTLVCAR